MEIEKLEIAKLDLKDGDILSVIHREPLAYAYLKDLHDSLYEMFRPIGIRLMVLSGDYEIKIIHKDEDNPDATLCH